MRCPEVRHAMRQFIDGRVDSETRKQVGQHLIRCEECSRLIEDEKNWDDAVLALLEHEAPDDLRAQILSDAGVDPTTAKVDGGRADLNRMSWRTKLGILRWAATRDNSLRMWLETAALVAGVALVVHFSPRLFSPHNKEAFNQQGPVTVIVDGQVLNPDMPLAPGTLSLAGRLY